MKTTTASAALLFLLDTVSVQAAKKHQCLTFKEFYYGTAKAMCENMCNGAFKYEPRCGSLPRRTLTGP